MKIHLSILCTGLLYTNLIFAAETADKVTETEFFNSPADTMLDSVAVTGVNMSLHEEIISLLLSGKGGFLNEGLVEYDVKSVTDYLHEHGWWNASVTTSVNSSSVAPFVLVFKIDTGKPLLFGQLTRRITDEADTSLPPLNGKLYGKQFSKKLLENAVYDIVSYFTSDGYPDVSVTPSFKAQGDTVNIILNINAGLQAHIDSIAVRGLESTREYVIQRELSSLPGHPAGQYVIGEARSRIERLNFVGIENVPAIDYDEEGNCILVVTLAERKQGSFEGVLGYQPAKGAGSGEMIGKIDLGFANMFGTGRSSRVRWENFGQDTEDLEIQYREPWILGQPYTVSMAFIQEERERRGYTKSLMSVGLGRHIGKLHIDSGFMYEKVSADTLHSSKALGIDLGVTWSAVDNPLNPSRGIRYGTSWSLASKRYRFGTGERTRYERTEFELDHYIPLLSQHTVAVLVRYRRVNIPLKNLAPSDRYWLGGAATIRGYPENMAPAVRALWSNIEYRFLTGRASRVFVFVDTGYLENQEKSDGKFKKKIRTLTGYGFGLRLESRIGMVGVDYGLTRGDSPANGKLHVMMQTEF